MMSRTLSGGMKRRLMIARAMMTRPRLLILDEPTAGVDIEIRRGMWKTLQARSTPPAPRSSSPRITWRKPRACAATWRSSTSGRIVEQGPMKALLAKLDVEGFLFDIDGTLPATLPAIEGTTLHRHRRPHPRRGDAARDGPQPRVRRAGRRRHPRALDAHQEQPPGRTVRAPDRRRRQAAKREQPTQSHTPQLAVRRTRNLVALRHHRPPRGQAHPAHLGPDPGAAGDHDDAVLPDLRRPDRLAHRRDGRLQLHGLHRARAW